MSYKRLTILCDLDSIVVDLQTKWYAVYNEKYNDNITVDDITDWEVHKFVSDECGTKIYNMLTPKLFDVLDPLDGAIEALDELYQAGHEIVFITASPLGCADAKISWVTKHIKWATHKNVIIGHKKHLVKGDVLIDDSPANLHLHKLNNPETKLLTISYPYNEEVDDICDVRSGSWRDTRTFWKDAVKFIEELSYEKV